MARTNDTPRERPVPIAAVAEAVGFGHAPELVWQRLRAGDAFEDWDYSACISSTRAREIVDAFKAGEEQAREIQAQRDAEHERKQGAEREQARREAEAAAPPSGGRIPGGLQISAPGGYRPAWMDDE